MRIKSPEKKFSGKTAVATFGGGCFWCMVAPYDKLDGVLSVVAGYTGGTKPNPTYDEVSTGTTGYVETVQVTFDPARTTYTELLDIYWHSIDPTDDGGQFADRGTQYRSVIFYFDEKQREEATASLIALNTSGKFARPVVTTVEPLTTFYPAEEYHQNYYKKNPVAYNRYKKGSGRETFLEKTWSEEDSEEESRAKNNTAGQNISPNWTKPDNATLRKSLSKEQFDVTQCSATEAPFRNAYWDNHAPGIYVDVVSGEPLFSSTDKYDSGTGWPSFTKPIDDTAIIEKSGAGLFDSRTEVRSATADSHLGHVFNDGPGPTGERFCINSASLRFIPASDLEKEGYGRYTHLFNSTQ